MNSLSSSSPIQLGSEPSQHQSSNRSRHHLDSNPKSNRRKAYKQLIMRSYPLYQFTQFLRPSQQAISLPHDRRLPIRIRPVFALLTLLTILILSILGFKSSLHAFISIPKKLFHFTSFALVTGLFYSITDVDDASNFIWYWQHFNSILTGSVCFLIGGLGSEFVQLFLPWKVFSWGDLLANVAGCLVGYLLARALHKQYRHRREIASLYQPLVDDSREIGEDDLLEDEEAGDSARSLFGPHHPGLTNVWSDNLDEGTEYFRFEEDEVQQATHRTR